jgi:phage recombination protein Bet
MTDAGEMELSPEIIKSYLVPADSKITDQEIGFFLQMCKFQKLNPFMKEIYIVKYGAYPAAFIVGKETFLRRAKKNDTYQGHSVGISDDGKVAFAEVSIKDFKKPIKCEVEYDEYVQLKDGKPNKMWTSKPKTMLKKVALVQALREAFPQDLGGLYDATEVDQEEQIIDVEANEVKTAQSKSEKEATESEPSDSPESGASDSGDGKTSTTPVKGERLEILSKIKGVTKKKGGTTDKPWTKFTIETVGGSFYTTFDEVYATEASKIKGKDVEALIIYDVVVKGDQTYYNLAPVKGDKQEGFTVTG